MTACSSRSVFQTAVSWSFAARPFVRSPTPGGTILGTTNRGNPFRRVVQRPDGSTEEVDCSDDLVQQFRDNNIDALIAVGGDGSLIIADQLHKKGVQVVGVPKTIDNDLESTTMTFGFNTALIFATECIDRLHSTALSHRRIMVVEVMGRYAGWIALHAGLAGRADAILIPEIPYSTEILAAHIGRKQQEGKPYSIVVVAEGAKPLGGEVTVKSRDPGHSERLGGIAEIVAAQLQEQTGMESRSLALVPLLRGASTGARIATRSHVRRWRSLRSLEGHERCHGGCQTAPTCIRSTARGYCNAKTRDAAE